MRNFSYKKWFAEKLNTLRNKSRFIFLMMYANDWIDSNIDELFIKYKHKNKKQSSER